MLSQANINQVNNDQTTNNQLTDAESREYLKVNGKTFFNLMNSAVYLLCLIMLGVYIFSALIVVNNLSDLYGPFLVNEEQLQKTMSPSDSFAYPYFNASLNINPLSVFTAAMLVSFPLYIGLLAYIVKKERKNPLIKKNFARIIFMLVPLIILVPISAFFVIYVIFLLIVPTQIVTLLTFLKTIGSLAITLPVIAYHLLVLKEEEFVSSILKEDNNKL